MPKPALPCLLLFVAALAPAQDPPKDPAALLAQAGAARTAGRLEEAAALAAAAAAAAPADAGARLLLARILRESGREEDALPHARKAAALAADPALKAEAAFEEGASLRQKLVRLAGQEGAEQERALLLEEARDLLEESLRAAPARGEAWIQLANLHAWTGTLVDELAVLRRGLDAAPEDELLHRYLQDRLFAHKLFDEATGLLNRLLEERPENAAGRWFLGRAWLAFAEECRRLEQADRALAAYGKAVAAWSRAMAERPAFAAASRESIAAALVGTGALLVAKGDLRGARTALLQAVETWPGIFAKPDTFGTTYAGTMGLIGMNLLAGQAGLAPDQPTPAQAAGLRDAAVHFRDLIERHPEAGDHLAYWYNNLGLALRDLGAAVGGGQGGASPEARKLWEESYAAYLQAAERLPDDPRILNDCALVQVFHLGTDLDRAEAMLIRARDRGLALIEEEKESWTEERRQFLEEAVGDAWSNLGLLYGRYRQEAEKAKACAAEADRYYPRRQRRREGETGEKRDG